MSGNNNGSVVRRSDFYIVTIIVCLTVMVTALSFARIYVDGVKNGVDVSVSQTERRWQLLNEYNDGWVLLDAANGEICAVSRSAKPSSSIGVKSNQCWSAKD